MNLVTKRSNIRSIKTEKTRCSICEDEGGGSEGGLIEFHRTRRHIHLYCQACLAQYMREPLLQSLHLLNKHIFTNIDIKCPGDVFCSRLDNRCSFRKISFLAIYNKLAATQQLHNHTLLTAVVRRCRDPAAYRVCCTCHTLQAVDALIRSSSSPSSRQCPDCNNTWCDVCGVSPYHENYQSCTELDLANNQALKKLYNSGILKFCPKCRTLVEKDGGCSKCVCRECGVKWCWRCEETDIDYDHYSKKDSPCQDRLWH
jgi:hypothetical protein